MIVGILDRYFGRSFLKTVLAVFGGVFFLIFTIDLVETLRRTGETPGANGLLMAWLSLLHTPIVAEQALPFAVLLGSMIAFLNLSRRLELVVARAAGVSVWRFLSPALIVALAIGVVAATIYNPLSTAMKRQSDAIEAKLFGAAGSRGRRSVVAAEERRRPVDHPRRRPRRQRRSVRPCASVQFRPRRRVRPASRLRRAPFCGTDIGSWNAPRS